jgi:prolipoprotein diacylglyceryltransferase
VGASPILHRPGELFLLVLCGYTTCRLALQPLRAERAARVDATLALSALFVVLSLVGLVLLRA